MITQTKYSSFSSNSEAFASELVGNLEERVSLLLPAPSSVIHVARELILQQYVAYFTTNQDDIEQTIFR